MQRVAIYFDETVEPNEYRVRPAALILGPHDQVVRFTNHTARPVEIEGLQELVALVLKPKGSFVWTVPRGIQDGAHAYRVWLNRAKNEEAVGNSAPHVIIDRTE